MRKLLFAVAPFIATAALAQTTEDATKFAATITAADLKEKLTIIASADMEGRETATPGQKKAAAFIEEQFKKLGLKPGNGNSYQQVYPVYQDELTDKKLSVNGKTFEWDKDYSISLQSVPNGAFSYSEVTFAGYGIVDSAGNINDYAGLDVTGKIVVVLDGAPDGYKSAAPAGGRRFNNPSSTFGKMAAARTKGAAGIVIISKDFPHKTATATQGNMYVNRPAAGSPSFLAATVSEEIGSALLGRTRTVPTASLKESPKGVFIAELKIAAEKVTHELQSSNVMGLMEGTDKKDEYVILTGHYDHLGKKGDVIWYGADDDGSGTTTVLEMAKAFAEAKKKGMGPRRNILFMTVSGEEKGLWGSQYYSEHPVYSLDKTTVDLNTDMVGRVDTERKTADSLNYVYVIGHDKLSSDLPVINEDVNKKYTQLVLDYKYDDPNDQNRIYFRSDHYNFARKGVPILFFYDGMLKADYHQPTDTVDKINFSLMEKRVRMIFYTAWVMANREKMLKRDIPLNVPNR